MRFITSQHPGRAAALQAGAWAQRRAFPLHTPMLRTKAVSFGD
jgi:hypothetical protein